MQIQLSHSNQRNKL